MGAIVSSGQRGGIPFRRLPFAGPNGLHATVADALPGPLRPANGRTGRRQPAARADPELQLVSDRR